MEYLFIYLLQMADKLSIISAILITVGLIGLFIYFMAFFASNGNILEEKHCSKMMIETIKKVKNILVICLIFGFFFYILPTRNTLLLMGGVYLGKKAVNTVITDEKVKKVNQIIELELDKRIGELKKYANNDNSTNKQEI